MQKTPADMVIEMFGGHAAIAKLLKTDVSRVYRWTYPIEKKGMGGLVPQKHQIKLLTEARKRGLALTPADFFPPKFSETPEQRGVAA